LDPGRPQGPAWDIVVSQLELAEVGDDDDLVLVLDDDVLEVAEVEFVDVQAPLRRTRDCFGEALRRPVQRIGLGEEVAAECFLGNLRVERARDVLGELFGIEERRLLPEAIHRPPEDLLQRRSALQRRALGHVPFSTDDNWFCASISGTARRAAAILWSVSRPRAPASRTSPGQCWRRTPSSPSAPATPSGSSSAPPPSSRPAPARRSTRCAG